MSTVDLETWGQIAALAAAGAAFCGVVLRAIGKLDAKIDRLDVKIDTTREDLRAEFKTDIAALTTIVLRLDERVYDLATGHRQSPLIVPPH